MTALIELAPGFVAGFLRKFPQVHDVVPCIVRIGHGIWPAARYQETREITPGCPAYERGERRYEREVIYAIGPLPSAYTRSSRVAFTIPTDPRDWYIGGYYSHAEPNEYHPFGKCVMFSPWDTGGKIDDGDRPYRRVKMLVRPDPLDTIEGEARCG